MTTVRAALLVTSLLVASQSVAEAPPPATPQASAAPAASPAMSTAAAPATPAPSVNRVGLGVGIGSGGTSPALYVPFDFGGTRLELEGAYAKAGTSDVETSTGRLGVGVFGLWDAGPAVRGSAGARVQYARAAVSGSEFGAHSDAVRIVLALGGEWVPVPSVSLGVEGQAGYSAGIDNSVSGLDVSAQAILRVFLSSETAKPSGATSSTSERSRPTPTTCERDSDCGGRDICFEGRCRH